MACAKFYLVDSLAGMCGKQMCNFREIFFFFRKHMYINKQMQFIWMHITETF